LATTTPHERAQLERAQGRWELVVSEDPCASERLEKVRRALRLKRFERSELASKLPGTVRRGAYIDLLPLLERLRAAGLAADLVERRGGSE